MADRFASISTALTEAASVTAVRSGNHHLDKLLADHDRRSVVLPESLTQKFAASRRMA
jgi:hypothetical protein